MKSNITGKASVVIDASASKVWEALTTPELIKKYFFNTNVISDWKAGNPIVFEGEWEGKKYRDKGTILQSVPNKVFKYNYWSSRSGIEDKPENYVDITYDITEKNSGTELTVTQENIPGEAMKGHAEENWKKVLTGLKDMLEKDPVEK